MRLPAEHLSILATLSVTLLFLNVRSALEIHRLAIPRWVENGTDEQVVLDCEYLYNENDLRLVVKWFFNDEVEPVYQWIPELQSRHVSGLLYGRLNMDYTINPADPYSQYRALSIQRPTAELSGKYTCLITSLAGQVSRQQEMTVYAPARVFRFNYTISHEELVNFTCSADGVYPEPRIKVFYLISDNKRRVFEGESRTLVKKHKHSYDILHWTAPNGGELKKDTLTTVECYLEVFGSPYRRAKRITYFPGVQGQEVFTNSVSKLRLSLPVTLLIVSLAKRFL